jgi:hypothetical protein
MLLSFIIYESSISFFLIIVCCLRFIGIYTLIKEIICIEFIRKFKLIIICTCITILLEFGFIYTQLRLCAIFFINYKND